MGGVMSELLEGLYVGGYKAAQDVEGLKEHGITHIIAVMDAPKKPFPDKFTYFCIDASDIATQDLSAHFENCIEFIHKARVSNGKVLVHCYAGCSRSVTICAVYIMTVTGLHWEKTLESIQGVRKFASPNMGFKKQLQEYGKKNWKEVRKDLESRYGEISSADEERCRRHLENNALSAAQETLLRYENTPVK